METMVCICGAGTMGRGIALAVIRAGIPTILYDQDPEMIANASAFIQKELDTEVDKKRMTAEEKKETIHLIRFSSSADECKSPLIIEAIFENTQAKSELFSALEKINSPETIFASNTSSLRVTEIAEATSFPERIVGLHFFNPANRMKLVEIVCTRFLSDEIIQRMSGFVAQLGKTAVICEDAPGFIVNHVARPFYLEALKIAEEGTADLQTIDLLMESAGFKMGPFHLMDLIGNDINYIVSTSLYEALGKPARLKPSRLQEEKVKSKALGRKTGEGFFRYDQMG